MSGRLSYGIVMVKRQDGHKDLTLLQRLSVQTLAIRVHMDLHQQERPLLGMILMERMIL